MNTDEEISPISSGSITTSDPTDYTDFYMKSPPYDIKKKDYSLEEIMEDVDFVFDVCSGVEKSKLKVERIGRFTMVSKENVFNRMSANQRKQVFAPAPIVEKGEENNSSSPDGSDQ